MKKIIEIGMALLVTVSWWGVVYPHLMMLEDTCRIVNGAGEVRMMENAEEYFNILQAEPGEIHIKSKLFDNEE